MVLSYKFEVLEYGDYWSKLKEETIGEFGRAVIFKYSDDFYVVESTVSYKPFYEERHYTSRKGARNFAYKATTINGYILKNINKNVLTHTDS